MNPHNEQKFRLTYSAKRREEINSIRKKYLPEEEDKMERLRRLDRSVTRKAQTVSLCLGILGALILGFGMSLVMTEMADYFGLYQNQAMLIGVIVGIVGGALASLAYPIHQFIVKRERKKIAPEIIRLTDELMK